MIRKIAITLFVASLLSGCASVDGNQRTTFNGYTGGHRITELAPGIFLVAAKSGFYIPSEIPLNPAETLVNSLMGQGIESARKHWVEVADEICGKGGYNFYGEQEYAYRYTPAYPQHVAVKSAYIVCHAAKYSEEEIKKFIYIN